MALTALAQLVKKNVSKAGVGHQVNVALALERAQKVLVALLDEETIRVVHPLSIRSKTLTLACGHSSAAACVGPFEQEVIDYVNSGFSFRFVERMRVILEPTIPQEYER